MAKPNQLSDVFKWCEHHKDPELCCNWLRSKSKKGYGYIRFEGKTINTHVAAFCASRGFMLTDIRGQCVCHTCDNPTCVNPIHLFLGTQKQNIADMICKNRAPSRYHPIKLTPNDILTIRQRHANGETTQSELALMFDVARSMISMIIARKTWKHIP